MRKRRKRKRQKSEGRKGDSHRVSETKGKREIKWVRVNMSW